MISQIVWVLLPDDLRDPATTAAVLLLAAAGASHAAMHRGVAWAATLYGTTAAIGLAVEAVGTATGYPFGEYRYGDSLGPMVLDVPLLIPLAWCMAVYPMLLLARGLATRRAHVVLIGAWTITAWDLFLDPQMVGEGHWRFADPTPALPGSPGIPLTNYAGWFLTGLLIFWVLDHLPRTTRRRPDAAPAHAVDLRLERDGRRGVLRAARGRPLGRARHGPDGPPLGAPGDPGAAALPRDPAVRRAGEAGRAAVLAATALAAGTHGAHRVEHPALRRAPVPVPGDPIEPMLAWPCCCPSATRRTGSRRAWPPCSPRTTRPCG